MNTAKPWLKRAGSILLVLLLVACRTSGTGTPADVTPAEREATSTRADATPTQRVEPTSTPVSTLSPTSTSLQISATATAQATQATATAQAVKATATGQAIQATVTTSSRWPLVLRNTFDTNEDIWPTDPQRDAYRSSVYTLANSKYRWDLEAQRDIYTTVRPKADPVSDFYLCGDSAR